MEHKIKGQGLYAYVALSQGEAPSEALRKSLVAAVRQQIGAFAAPDVIHWAPGAPTAPAAHPDLQYCCKWLDVYGGSACAWHQNGRLGVLDR